MHLEACVLMLEGLLIVIFLIYNLYVFSDEHVSRGCISDAETNFSDLSLHLLIKLLPID
jgi:hypothetical protein